MNRRSFLSGTAGLLCSGGALFHSSSPTADTVIKLDAETIHFEMAMDELLGYMTGLPFKLRCRLASLLEPSGKLITVKLCNSTPVRALTVTLEPSDFLLDLLAALRVGNLDRFVLQAGGGRSEKR